MKEYKILWYNAFSRANVLECFKKKLDNRYYKTLLYVDLDTLTLEFDNVLKMMTNGCFDGIIVYNVAKVLDIMNIDLFIKFMKCMPAPYDTRWEFYINFVRIDTVTDTITNTIDDIAEASVYKNFLPDLTGIFCNGAFKRFHKGDVCNRIEYPSSDTIIHGDIVIGIISEYQ
jgi:hypothetical protein